MLEITINLRDGHYYSLVLFESNTVVNSAAETTKLITVCHTNQVITEQVSNWIVDTCSAILEHYLKMLE